MNSCGILSRLIAKTTGMAWGVWLGCNLFFGGVVRADDLPTGTNVWNFWFKSGMFMDEALSTPAVAQDGTVYVGAFSGRLHALGADDGVEKWHFVAGSEIKSSPAVADDGTIYFGSRDRHFYAVTPAGRLKWKFVTGAWVDSSPAIATDGEVYFGSWDRNFYALKPDGSLKWKYAVGSIVDSSPAIGADGTIYFGAHDGKFYALSPAGQLVWTFATGAEITSSPAIGEEGDLYFSSTDGYLYRLKADGKEVWRFRIGGGGDGSPVLAENGNVMIAAATRMYMVSPAGAKVWEDWSPCWIDQTPVVLRGAICYSAPWRTLRAIDLDGKRLWEVNTTNNLSSSPVIGGNGVIYCSCSRHVEALRPPMPVYPAISSWPMFRANARHTGRVNTH